MNTMTTDDIIESLNHAAISKQGIPNEVLHQAAGALMERDELRAAVEWESSRVDALHLAQATDKETIEQLRAKYDDIMETYQNVIDEKCAGDERHCTCVPFLRMEVDRLRVALRQIGQSIEPEADQLQNWIAGQVDAALGEVAE